VGDGGKGGAARGLLINARCRLFVPINRDSSRNFRGAASPLTRRERTQTNKHLHCRLQRNSPATLHAMCFVPISSEDENGFVADSGRASRVAVRAKKESPRPLALGASGPRGPWGGSRPADLLQCANWSGVPRWSLRKVSRRPRRPAEPRPLTFPLPPRPLAALRGLGTRRQWRRLGEVRFKQKRRPVRSRG
jgi:hypothetical protein